MRERTDSEVQVMTQLQDVQGFYNPFAKCKYNKRCAEELSYSCSETKDHKNCYNYLGFESVWMHEPSAEPKSPRTPL